MKKSKMLASIALSLPIAMSLPSYVHAENLISNVKVSDSKRISGKDRYLTSIEVSKSGWEKGSENLIIASGEEFPDALCAVPLSKKFDAPILLVSKNNIKKETLDEIKRLNPKKVFIMGLKGSISENIEKEIKKRQTSINIERVGGKDRYETSAKIAEKLNNSNVVIVSGQNFADALSIASIAAQKEMPILLTAKNNMSSYVGNYLKGKNIEGSILVGGTGIISKEIEAKLPKVERIYGNDRYSTNMKVINRFKSDIKFESVFLAVGGPDKTDFADALSGAALAAKTSSSLILLDKNTNEFKKELITKDLLKGIENFKTVALGGTSVIREKVLDDIKLSVQNVIDNNGNVTEKPTTPTQPVVPSVPTIPTVPVVGDKDKLLKDINGASENTVEQIIINNVQSMGINLSSYSNLSGARQATIWSDLIGSKPDDGYKTLSDVAKVFNDLVVTRTIIEQELNKVNAAVDAKSIDTLKDLGFLTNVSRQINASSYTMFSGLKINAMKLVFDVDGEYNKLKNNDTEGKLKNLISKKYQSYSQMLDTLNETNK